ncbi:hypothetical protein Sfin6_0080 [Shigella phage Sfin-6]|uniref:Uncharacterized protein n=1 Tax=Shigella phage Sfin-6 TaxID=2608403 RepID=A0A7G3P3F8_9CAUD|nr:hypothetical protein Sfin6_0080 [Shigella phage Sfin-6]
MITDKGDYLEFYERDPSDTRKEDAHQVDCVSWLKYNFPQLLFWHTVNEGEKQSLRHLGMSRLDYLKAYQTLLF